MPYRPSVLSVIVTFLLILSYVFLPRYGFVGFSGFWEHVLYPFSHANIFHLLANVVCVLALLPRFGWMELLFGYLVSVLSSFLPCFCSEPTMGFSGVLFALVGESWGVVGRFKEMLMKNKWFLLIPMFLPHVNGFIHLYCLLGGYLVGRLKMKDER